MAEVLLQGNSKAVAVDGVQRGEIITIQPDGWQWSSSEHLGKWKAQHGSEVGWNSEFYVVKIPDLPFNGDVHQQLVSPLLGPPDADGIPAIVDTRRYYADWAALTSAPAFAIAAVSGECELSLAVALAFVRDKATNGGPF